MSSQKENMLNGLFYDPQDKELAEERLQARLLLRKLNETPETEKKLRAKLSKQLIPNTAANLWIQSPFYCDYGYNIVAGENVFFNFNCTVLDVMKVTIGSRTLFGPNVQIYTASHPVNHEERVRGLGHGKPVTIGEDVWIGGAAIICPGVTIGDRSIIGAGSVVTKDIPADVMAAGNPCKVIRSLKE
jgi:maltose O-acetyltransferase